MSNITYSYNDKPCNECRYYNECKAHIYDSLWDRGYKVHSGLKDCWTPKVEVVPMIRKDEIIKDFESIMQVYPGLSMDLVHIVRLINRADDCKCENCKYLEVMNAADGYAKCTNKYINIVFKPFELDTKTHCCNLWKEK